VGSGYSYTRLVQTDEVMLSLGRFTGVESIDREAGVAVVRAGTTMRQLTRELAARGYALENLGDIDKQTVAGAVGTGTHGTGIGIGNISTQIEALEMVTAQGDVVRCSARDGGRLFRAAQVSLGALGVITRVWLKVMPLYWLEIERRRVTFDRALLDFDANVRANRNYEFFWFPDSDLVYSKRMNLAASSARAGLRVKRYLNDLVNENAALWLVCQINDRWPGTRRKLLEVGSSFVPQDNAVERADRAYATERLVVHQEMEYAVPYERTVEALAGLDALLRRFPTRTVFPIEVRFTRGDDIWMSPSYGRDVSWIAVHTYWKEDHCEYFDAAESLFRQLGGRPHWGKLHGLDATAMRGLYPGWDAFAGVREEMDPNGVFENRYVRRLLGPVRPPIDSVELPVDPFGHANGVRRDSQAGVRSSARGEE
jgi:FAD-linked oxidoreductase